MPTLCIVPKPRVYEYPAHFGGLIPDSVIRSETRLPSLRAYPAWLRTHAMWNLGRGGWIVQCEICDKWTGRNKNRRTLARFLRAHRRCGFLPTRGGR